MFDFGQLDSVADNVFFHIPPAFTGFLVKIKMRQSDRVVIACFGVYLAAQSLLLPIYYVKNLSECTVGIPASGLE